MRAKIKTFKNNHNDNHNHKLLKSYNKFSNIVLLV